jgi:hypothetical protein
MGYSVETLGVDFIIPAENLEAAFTALKELNKHNELKSGGSFGRKPDGSYGQTGWHFAWMDEDYDKTSRDAEHVLNQLGFQTSLDDEGLRIEWYDGEKKGDEEHFLEALAPFVKPGSYIEWEGEDRQRWRQDFDGETMTERSGRISWE